MCERVCQCVCVCFKEREYVKVAKAEIDGKRIEINYSYDFYYIASKVIE